VVHLQKGRAATWHALGEAWARLESGGRLLLVGGNELGIKSAVKRLAGELGQPAAILANRARARVACWRREGAAEPAHPVIPPVEVVTGDDRFELESAAGVFSADGVDPGTRLLLSHLDAVPSPAAVFDPGCGLGILGLAALRRWPGATAVLADVDYRAVGCVTASAAVLGLADRCEIVWWDAALDPAPTRRCDLVLVNPPFHSGVPVNLQPARAIFRAIDAVLVPGGRALVVANRTLPWEHDLRSLGTLRQLEDTRGYKVLEIKR
jgi:16S rRNA (guanine1207-N2)-methyltransferase